MNRGDHLEDLFRSLLEFGASFQGGSARLAGLEGRAITLDKASLSSKRAYRLEILTADGKVLRSVTIYDKPIIAGCQHAVDCFHNNAP